MFCIGEKITYLWIIGTKFFLKCNFSIQNTNAITSFKTASVRNTILTHLYCVGSCGTFDGICRLWNVNAGCGMWMLAVEHGCKKYSRAFFAFHLL